MPSGPPGCVLSVSWMGSVKGIYVLMQPSILGLEVVAEPSVEVLRKDLLIVIGLVFDIISNITEFIEQALVVGLMVHVLVVMAFTHDLFFPGEMG